MNVPRLMPFLDACLLARVAAVTPLRAQSTPNAGNPDLDSIFQFFAQSQAPGARFGSGAYPWIPPKKTTIRAVMIGVHNGLPLPILQNPSIRAVGRWKCSPVSYFVQRGPGIIQNGAFIPTEIPAGLKKPIEVTLGAYQLGSFKETGGVKPAGSVYQTFHLLP